MLEPIERPADEQQPLLANPNSIAKYLAINTGNNIDPENQQQRIFVVNNSGFNWRRWVLHTDYFSNLLSIFLSCIECPDGTHQALPENNQGSRYVIAFIRGMSKGWSTFFDTLWPTAFTMLLIREVIYASVYYGDVKKIRDILIGISPYQFSFTSNMGYALGDLLWPALVAATPTTMAVVQALSDIHSAQPFDFSENSEELATLRHAARPENSSLLFSIPLHKFRRALHHAEFAFLWDKNLFPAERDLLFREIKNIAENSGAIAKSYALQSLASIIDRMHIEPPTGEIRDDDDDNLIKMRTSALVTLQQSSAALPIYSRYLRWLINDPSYHSTFFRSLFWLMTAYTAYTSLRFAEVFTRITISSLMNYYATATCIAENKIWMYSKEFAGPVCGVCPDWLSFVSRNAIFDPQSCLTGLLAAPLPPAELTAGVQRLLMKNNFTDNIIINIDLSLQSLGTWNLSEINTFFAQFPRLTPPNHAYQFDFSNSLSAPPWPNDGRIEIIANNLQQLPVTFISFTNQQMGPLLAQRFAEIAITNKTLQFLSSLEFSGNNIGDVGLAALAKSLNSSTLPFDFLDVSFNNISDSGLTSLAKTMHSVVIPNLVLSSNNFGQKGISALGEAYEANPMQDFTLDLSNNDLSKINMTTLWSAFPEDSSVGLNLASTNFDDSQAKQLANHPQFNLITIDVTNNTITGDGATAIANLAPVAVSFSNNPIDDTGMANIANAIRSHQIESSTNSIYLAGCNYTITGLATFVNNTLNLSVRTFSFANNNLGDAGARIIIANLQSRSTFIDFSENNVTDVGAVEIYNTIVSINSQKNQYPDPISLLLSGNNITDAAMPALAPALPYINLLDLSYNQMGPDGIKIIAPAISRHNPSSGVPMLEALYIAGNPIGDEGAIALSQALITPVPHLADDASAQLSLDDYIDLTAAKPITQLGQSQGVLDLADTGITADGARLLCRVLPLAKVNMSQAILSPNPNVNPNAVDLNNCQIFSHPVPTTNLFAAEFSTMRKLHSHGEGVGTTPNVTRPLDGTDIALSSARTIAIVVAANLLADHCENKDDTSFYISLTQVAMMAFSAITTSRHPTDTLQANLWAAGMISGISLALQTYGKLSPRISGVIAGSVPLAFKIIYDYYLQNHFSCNELIISILGMVASSAVSYVTHVGYHAVKNPRAAVKSFASEISDATKLCVRGIGQFSTAVVQSPRSLKEAHQQQTPRGVNMTRSALAA